MGWDHATGVDPGPDPSTGSFYYYYYTCYFYNYYDVHFFTRLGRSLQATGGNINH